MKKIGIVGNGFVGNSVAFGFSPTHEVRIHDKDPKKNLNTIEEVSECDYIFVCVPTPMFEHGEQDTQYIQNVFNYAFNTSNNFVSSSWAVNSDWNAISDRPSTVQFRFKVGDTPPPTNTFLRSRGKPKDRLLFRPLH